MISGPIDSGLHCLKCGYSLTGLPSGKCPECGTVFDVDDLRTSRAKLSCPKCGYDIHGSPPEKCPWCGHSLSAVNIETNALQRRKARLLAFWLLASVPGAQFFLCVIVQACGNRFDQRTAELKMFVATAIGLVALIAAFFSSIHMARLASPVMLRQPGESLLNAKTAGLSFAVILCFMAQLAVIFCIWVLAILFALGPILTAGFGSAH